MLLNGGRSSISTKSRKSQFTGDVFGVASSPCLEKSGPEEAVKCGSDTAQSESEETVECGYESEETMCEMEPECEPLSEPDCISDECGSEYESGSELECGWKARSVVYGNAHNF